jgi:hypothetical protein
VRQKTFNKEDNLAEGQTSLCCSAYARATFDENIHEEGRLSTFWNFKTQGTLFKYLPTISTKIYEISDSRAWKSLTNFSELTHPLMEPSPS